MGLGSALVPRCTNVDCVRADGREYVCVKMKAPEIRVGWGVRFTRVHDFDMYGLVYTDSLRFFVVVWLCFVMRGKAPEKRAHVDLHVYTCICVCVCVALHKTGFTRQIKTLYLIYLYLNAALGMRSTCEFLGGGARVKRLAIKF